VLVLHPFSCFTVEGGERAGGVHCIRITDLALGLCAPQEVPLPPRPDPRWLEPPWTDPPRPDPPQPIAVRRDPTMLSVQYRLKGNDDVVCKLVPADCTVAQALSEIGKVHQDAQLSALCAPGSGTKEVVLAATDPFAGHFDPEKVYIVRIQPKALLQVIIKGMTPHTTEDEVTRFLSPVAVPKAVNVASAGVIAFATFETGEECQLVIDRLNGQTLRTKQVTVEYPDPNHGKKGRGPKVRSQPVKPPTAKPPGEDSNLYISGLAPTIVSNEELKAMFAIFGSVQRCRLLQKHTALVEFSTHEEAEAAYEWAAQAGPPGLNVEWKV
jgi:hypothetical protein